MMNRKIPFLMAWILIVISTATAYAVDYKIKTLDLVAEMPVANDDVNSANAKLTSAKCSYGDLVSKNAISSMSAGWFGTFGKDAAGNKTFQAGYTYFCKLQILFTNENGTNYYANYVKSGGNFNITGFTVTLNGKKVILQDNCAIRAPVIGFTYTVPGEISSSVRENAIKKFEESEAEHRSIREPYDAKLADTYLVENCAHATYIYKGGSKESVDLEGQSNYYVTRALAEGLTTDKDMEIFLDAVMFGYPYMRDVWIGNDCDATKVFPIMYEELLDQVFRNYRTSQYYTKKSYSILTTDGTIYIPESQWASIKPYLKSNILHPVCRVKAYKGDVHAAMASGSSYEICTKHDYTAAIRSADRVYKFTTCKNAKYYFYSCTYCGKIERNPNHLFCDVKEGPQIVTTGETATHDYILELATDDAYIGVNAAGQHVYWRSCGWCHIDQGHGGLGKGEQKKTKFEAEREHQVYLITDEARPYTFTMPYKSKAKMSKWAQSDVNYALCDHLIDEQVLGGDYTLTATRKHLIAVCVLLAEELTGKKVSEGSGYSDAQDSYAKKASTIGVTADFAPSALSPSTQVTRQEMAAAMYRTLKYIEQNSDYSYSAFNSRLDKYTDKGQIKQWALEPMGFFEAVELIKGATATTITPNAACSIETVVSFAYNSTLAHKLGWHQLTPDGKTIKNETWAGGESFICTTMLHNERVWITGYRGSRSRIPLNDKYNGERTYGEEPYYHPVRATGSDPAKVKSYGVIESSSKSDKSNSSSKKSTTKKSKTKKSKSSSKDESPIDKIKSEGKKALKKGLKGILK